MLTQKESMLLKDLKDQEKVCIEKYDKYSQEACDEKLKTLFAQLGNTEREHLKTLNEIENGKIPITGASAPKPPTLSPEHSELCIGGAEKDKYLCTDALSTEKHVSSVYDTCIFEFGKEELRNALNHIQKEEQEHGKKIYDYMSQNGMQA